MSRELLRDVRRRSDSANGAKHLVVAVALACALAVSACGTSRTTLAPPASIAAAPSGHSLSADENHLCSVLVDNLAKLSWLTSNQTFAKSYRLEERYLAKFVSRLRVLKAPKAQKAEFASFVAGNEYALRIFRRLLPYILSNHLKAAEPLMRRGAIADSELRVLAKHLNLSACATGQAHTG
jgi:hypothetical protein